MNALQRVVVTGAGGFIGRAVCRALVERGCEIRALVAAPGIALNAPPRIAFDMRAEITDRAALRALLAGTGADAVVHLAGPPSVRTSFDDAAGYATAHTVGTATLLQACRDAGVSRLVYVSSAEVYGRPQTDPVAETHPLEARSPYAAAKIGAEQLVRAFDHAYATSSVIVRPFSVYGPGMGTHALLPAIVRQLGTPGPVRLADLRPERDYCHVDDVARGIMAAASAELTSTAAVNLGSGRGVSVRDLAQQVIALAGGVQAVEETGARRPGDAEILRLVADCNLAAELLGWAPQISLATGLRDMLPVAAA